MVAFLFQKLSLHTPRKVWSFGYVNVQSFYSKFSWLFAVLYIQYNSSTTNPPILSALTARGGFGVSQ